MEVDVDASSNIFYEITQGNAVENNIILSYSNIYDNIKKEAEFIKLNELKVQNSNFSLFLNGEVKLEEFNFNLEINNKDFLINLIVKSLEDDFYKINNGNQAILNGKFKNKEEFVQTLKKYKYNINNVLNEISAKNNLTTKDKDIFKIVSDPIKIFYVNGLDYMEFFEIIQKHFADEFGQ